MLLSTKNAPVGLGRSEADILNFYIIVVEICWLL